MPTHLVGSTITVNSVDRISSGDTFDNFEIDLTNGRVLDINADVLVRWVSIPNTAYNVCTYTKVFTWKESNGSVTIPLSIEIPEDDYTGSQLASEIESRMTAKSAADGHGFVYTVTYGSPTKAKFKFEIDGDDGREFWLTFGDSSAPMSRLLGFANGVDTSHGVGAISGPPSAAAVPLVSTYLAQLFSALSYQIHLQGFFDGQTSSRVGQGSDILISVQNKVRFGDVLFYEPTDSNEAYHVRELFGRKRFYLTCDFGNGLGPKPAPIQGDWEMFLAVRRYRSDKPQPKLLYTGLETQSLTL